MSKRYHFNPFSGEPGECKAQKACPYGSLSTGHYGSPAEARAAFEAEQGSSFSVPDPSAEALGAFLKERVESSPAEELLEPALPPLLAREIARLEELEAQEEEAHALWLKSITEAEERVGAKSGRAYLSEEVAAGINVDGITCASCGRNLNSFEAATILNEMNDVSCPCGELVDLYSVAVKVGESKDTYPAYIDENVYAMTWYHSTLVEDWEDKLSAGEFSAHVGSLQASFDRQIAENYSGSTAGRGFWLYELQVAPEASLSPEVEKDENQSYVPSRGKGEEWNIVRYVNKWEDMASLSLAVRSDKLQVKGKRFVEAEEALESPSLYNVSPDHAEKRFARNPLL